MLEALLILLVGIVVVAVAFVCTVALLVFCVAAMNAATWILDAPWSSRSAWTPPDNQISDAYKARIQRVRGSMAYRAPVFVNPKKHKESK